MHQAFDAILDLHEGAVVGDVRDLAEHAGVRGITAGDVLPGIRTQLLQAQRNARALAVELQDTYFHFLADLHHFRRMLDALPRHVGDVQQAVDAAEVDEGAVVGEVLHRAFHHRAFGQVVHQRAALGGEFLLHDGTARHDHVVALLVELDDLEFQRLVLEVAGVAHGAHIHQRTGQERADVLQLYREATLHAAGDDAGDDLGFVEGLLEAGPGAGALGFFARQAGVALAVFHCIQRHFDAVASDDFDLAALIAELFDGNVGFGLQAHVDDDHVFADADDLSGQDLARLDALVGQTLFEHFAERFAHVDQDSLACARRQCDPVARLVVKRAPHCTVTRPISLTPS